MIFEKTKNQRKAINNRYFNRLIVEYEKTHNLDKLKSSGEWFLATQPAKRRFMLWLSIEQLKARVCADLTELSVVCERVQWKEHQLWHS